MRSTALLAAVALVACQGATKHGSEQRALVGVAATNERTGVPATVSYR